MSRIDHYENLGLSRVVNATTCLTRLGGSISHPDVFKAMEEASKAFIRIPELQAWAGKRIAETFGAEAGLPTAGAVNGLTLAAAACMMKNTDLEKHDPLKPQSWQDIIQKLPLHTGGLKTKFIVQANNRNTYDHAVECAGGELIEAGSKEKVEKKDLIDAYIEGETAAYYFTVKPSSDILPLNNVAKIAYDHGVPVIVDAAPFLTHKHVPDKLLKEGADILAFSGGKQLGGPNNSGILLGRSDLIKLAHLQAYPFDGIGRGAKMSRETIVGLIRALEIFVARDDESYYSRMEEETRRFSSKLDKIKGISSGIVYENTVVNDVTKPSYAYIEIDGEKNVTLVGLHRILLDATPPIETLLEPFFLIKNAENKITVKMEYLIEDDKKLILEKIKSIFLNARTQV
jgi:L-seryl-tRNA(Ser) seleniumtransferase